MNIGVCTSMNASGSDGVGLEHLGAYKNAGADYVELPLAQLMALDDSGRAQATQAVGASGLPCYACNNFFPAHLKVTGPAVDEQAVRAYAAAALSFVAALGASVVVFGSAGARNFPAGFSPTTAEAQFAAALVMAGDAAASRGITIVIEHLNRGESNLVNTFAEGAALAEHLRHPAVRCLLDYYHLRLGNEALAVPRPDLLAHAHLAATLGRAIPQDAGECDYAALFRFLAHHRYAGAVSIEGYASARDTATVEKEFTASVALVKRLAAGGAA
jgi:sugar phosphate isomerase/epimerase